MLLIHQQIKGLNLTLWLMISQWLIDSQWWMHNNEQLYYCMTPTWDDLNWLIDGMVYHG